MRYPAFYIAQVVDLSKETQIIFPLHARPIARIEEFNLDLTGIHFTDPLGYLEFLWLQKHARFVITDPGGIQEESTFLGIPCITVRDNTERPITITEGTNILVGHDFELLRKEVNKIISGHHKSGNIPKFWDGQSGMRIAMALENALIKPSDQS